MQTFYLFDKFNNLRLSRMKKANRPENQQRRKLYYIENKIYNKTKGIIKQITAVDEKLLAKRVYYRKKNRL